MPADKVKKLREHEATCRKFAEPKPTQSLRDEFLKRAAAYDDRAERLERKDADRHG